MSKFCEKCGALIEDDKTFCPSCGAQAATPAAPASNSIGDIIKNLPDNVRKLALAAVAIILAVILISTIFGGSGYNKAVNNYEAVMNGKAKKLEKLAPKEYWEYMADEADEDVDDYIDDKIDDFEDNYDDTLDYLEEEYGNHVKIKLKVEDKKKLTDKKIENLAEYLDDKYDIKEKSVKKGYELEIEATIKGSDDEDDDEMELYAIKIGGSWYLMNCNFDGDNTTGRFVLGF